ncbi:MAG: tRNA (N(6)-L-threonylcarbamoyladenosine(37)-C(2))-methylthiotransferase MtaB [Clostridia bacterium]|nr:tRNA (N(6)-L-threonylcarbamoyladenosine(37)-C(2))-methylthiotransferase MtaB [Clostridia bacterium]
MSKVAFITLGCKVNQYETNAMCEEFIKNNYQIVDKEEKADIYIVNTCTVTNMSDRKSRQMLRRVKELNENAIIVACGCYAQVANDELEKMEEIDLVLGNNEKKEIVKYVEEFIKEKNKIQKIEDVMKTKEFVDFGDVTFTEKTRAVIKIQDGCDRFCSYCIIPYARGKVRSRKKESIISEIERIAKEGIKEVVITGIHIASYGKDFKNDYKLINLLEEINDIEGIKRIRLGSLEPTLITEEFVKRLVKLNKICHHFHLSLQSGCDATLKRMNRIYTTEQFENKVNLLRKVYSDVLLTTDIIVGFPEETDEEFEITYKYLSKIKFYKMHVFKYSPRKGTPAAINKHQIDGNKKEERSRKLLNLSEKNENYYNQKYLGKKVEVLFEEEKVGLYKGHTQNYILVYCESEENLENKIQNVICTELKKDCILAQKDTM